MKRDKKLIRAILLEIEKRDDGCDAKPMAIEGYTAMQVNYNIKLLAQAGMLEVTDQGNDIKSEWTIYNMTWEGHDFLDKIRSDRNKD